MLLDFMEAPVKQHMETHQDLQPRDFLDSYIDEIKKTTDPTSSFYGDSGYISMRTVLLDLFSAGGESTSTTLSWYCLYLAVNPGIQEKLHAEISEVVGNSRCPNLSDRPLLPYLAATSLEILRITSLVPISIFHSTLSDAKIQDYLIPVDTMIIPNLYSCHFDKEYWGDPEIFKPNRFLDTDGKTILKHEPFIPFSYGKRICPGENLANLELFLIITSILQNFQISTDPDNPNPSLNPSVSFIQIPKPHKLVFNKRLL